MPDLSSSGKSVLQFGLLKLSPPAGIAPIRGRFSGKSHKASGVIKRRPSNGEGMTFVTRFGVVNTTTSVAIPTISAPGFGVKLLLTICSDCNTPP
ncbi:MAG: Uncharacterised protein [Cyanobium sp. ARS6]|nr:MAG: Uncharacterised protein [Cyanobium sp. ARS6]